MDIFVILVGFIIIAAEVVGVVIFNFVAEFKIFIQPAWVIILSRLYLAIFYTPIIDDLSQFIGLYFFTNLVFL